MVKNIYCLLYILVGSCVYIYHNYKYTEYTFLVTLDTLSSKEVALLKQFYYILLNIQLVYCVYDIRFTAKTACNRIVSKQCKGFNNLDNRAVTAR